MKILLYIPLKLMCWCKVIKKIKLPPKNKKLIIVANHQSGWDIVILFTCLPYRVRFIGKKELASNKFKKWFFSSMGVIFVDRDSISMDSMKQILRSLKNNEILAIFPEGTRNKSNELLLEFKSGAEHIAKKTQTPILITTISKNIRPFKINKYTIIEEYYCQQDVDNTMIIRNKMIESLKGENNE
jgi:1-acyl-sn-glycerol-3-phosphate acyltransferase